MLNVQAKTGLPPGEQEAVVSDMVKSYVEGLCWVLRYYYDGKHSFKICNLTPDSDRY